MSANARLSRLENRARNRALADVVEMFLSRTDEEIAAAFADPYDPPQAFDRGRQNALLKAAGAEDGARMREVVAALLEGLGPRKGRIRRLVADLRGGRA